MIVLNRSPSLFGKRARNVVVVSDDDGGDGGGDDEDRNESM